MGFFAELNKIIQGSVGNNMENDEDDVRAIRRSFSDIDVTRDKKPETEEEDTSLGLITRSLDNNIKSFQRENDLWEDGIINPDGETEKAITSRLGELRQEQEKEPVKPAPVSSPVFPRPNFSNSDLFEVNGRVESKKRIHQAFEKIKKQKPIQPVESDLEKLPKHEVLEKAEEELKSQSLIDAEKKAQKDLTFFKENKFKLSTRFFEHYLEGSAKPLKISSEEIDKSPRFSQAIETNKKRFEDSLVKGHVGGNKHEFKDQILRLKDGETIHLVKKPKDGTKLPAGDVWDRDLSPKPFPTWLYSSLLDKDGDQTYSTGAVKIRSLGELRATRKGNSIEITGDVFHTLQDRYDFNDDTVFDDITLKNYRNLAEKGKARVFQITGVKPQKVKAIINIKNEKIKDWNFEWRDTKL